MELETVVRDKALLRLADIFQVSVTSLHDDLILGADLKASFVSDFRRNELDLVHDDVYDVADRSLTKELMSGRLVIRTVGDYCSHMIRCSRVRMADVARLLKIKEDHF